MERTLKETNWTVTKNLNSVSLNKQQAYIKYDFSRQLLRLNIKDLEETLKLEFTSLLGDEILAKSLNYCNYNLTDYLIFMFGYYHMDIKDYPHDKLKEFIGEIEIRQLIKLLMEDCCKNIKFSTVYHNLGSITLTEKDCKLILKIHKHIKILEMYKKTLNSTDKTKSTQFTKPYNKYLVAVDYNLKNIPVLKVKINSGKDLPSKSARNSLLDYLNYLKANFEVIVIEESYTDCEYELEILTQHLADFTEIKKYILDIRNLNNLINNQNFREHSKLNIIVEEHTLESSTGFQFNLK